MTLPRCIRVAQLALIVFAGIAASLRGQIAADFSSGTMPDSLQLFHGAYGEGNNLISFADGVASFGADDSRTYLRTGFASYYNTSFTAEVSFRAQDWDYSFFFGLGATNMIQSENGPEGEPAPEPGYWNGGSVIDIRLQAPNSLGYRDNGDDWSFAEDASGVDLSTSWSRARFVWDGDAHTGVFYIDTNYNGTFSADFTSDVIDGSNNNFADGDTFLFFGGNGFNADDFMATAGTAVPEPSTYALIAGAAALGLVAALRRRKTAVGGGL